MPLRRSRQSTEDCCAHWHEGFTQNGGAYVPSAKVNKIEPLSAGGFEIFSDGGYRAGCEKLVIAAGHGSVDLGRMLGMEVPIFPVQGQIVVTERAPATMGLPDQLCSPDG
ncbi:MAG: hypothetical protein CM1200mP20_05670 [Pseudomonadota bacterium]|nr:MAG: hypothetical protein CM1200mP20_05670 [Pseudomonadota bacterium]